LTIDQVALKRMTERFIRRRTRATDDEHGGGGDDSQAGKKALAVLESTSVTLTLTFISCFLTLQSFRLIISSRIVNVNHGLTQ
jgi:hypothetical protein